MDVQSNKQLAFYLLCAENEKYAKQMDGKKLVGAIVQPKCDPGASSYVYSQDEMQDLYDAVFDAIDLAEEGGMDPTPGEHCMFCPAGPVCPAKLVEGQEAINLPKDLTLNLETALALAAQLEPWVKQVKTFAHEMLEKGAEIPGWKLVDKRAARSWTDEDETTVKVKAMRRLKQEDWANIRLKTAPQLEKICKVKDINFTKEFGPLTVKKSSGTTLAPEDDKRPAVTVDRLNQADVQAALAKL